MKSIRSQCMEYIRNASSSQISILEAIRREEQKPFIPYFFERRLLGSLVKKPDKNKKKVQSLPKLYCSVNTSQRSSLHKKSESVFQIVEGPSNLKSRQKNSILLSALRDQESTGEQMRKRDSSDSLVYPSSIGNYSQDSIRDDSQQHQQQFNFSKFKCRENQRTKNENSSLQTSPEKSLPRLSLVQKKGEASTPSVGFYELRGKQSGKLFSFAKADRLYGEKYMQEQLNRLLGGKEMKKTVREGKKKRKPEEDLKMFNDMVRAINRQSEREHEKYFRFRLPLNDLSKMEEAVESRLQEIKVVRENVKRRRNVLGGIFG